MSTWYVSPIVTTRYVTFSDFSTSLLHVIGVRTGAGGILYSVEDPFNGDGMPNGSVWAKVTP